MSLIQTAQTWIAATGKFADVGRAAAFARALQHVKALPAAYVIPQNADDGQNLTGSYVITQQERVRIAVFIGLDNLADATGASAADDYEDYREIVRSALQDGNRCPAGYTTPFERDGGELIGLDTGAFWWADYFITARIRRSTP